MCNRHNKNEGTFFEKQAQGPLVPLQYYTPTPVLSTSVAFFNVQVLCFPYCSEDIIHSITFLLVNSAVSPALSLPKMLHGKCTD